MTLDQIEALLRRNVVADLGEERAAELATALRSTAEALALVLGEPIGVEEEDPDFIRPLPQVPPGQPRGDEDGSGTR